MRATLLDRTYEVSPKAAREVLRPLHDAVTGVAFYLSPAACALFLQIYEAGRRGRRHRVPKSFRRNSPAHKLYRELRHSILIRPLKGGQWEAGKAVEICAFSDLLYPLALKCIREKAHGHRTGAKGA